MKSNLLLGAFAVLGSVCFASCSMCGGDELNEVMQQLNQEAQQNAQQQAAAAAAADPDATLFQKLGGYIDCYNATATSARDSQSRYFDWVNEKKGPNCKEKYISYGLFELDADAIQTCNNAVQQGRTMQPPLPQADAAAAQVAALYAQLQPINNQADTYYEQENYKDDKCAFAKQAHPQLVSLFGQFLTAADSLKLAIDQVKDEADLRQLAHLEKIGGRNFAWQMKRMMIYTKRIVDLYPDGQDPRKIKKDVYLPKFAEFEAPYKEFETYTVTGKAEIDNLAWASSVVDNIKEFYTYAVKMRRTYEKGKKLDPNDYNELIKAYNAMIGNAGRVDFD